MTIDKMISYLSILHSFIAPAIYNEYDEYGYRWPSPEDAIGDIKEALERLKELESPSTLRGRQKKAGLKP